MNICSLVILYTHHDSLKDFFSYIQILIFFKREVSLNL